jgi:squalene synthase HpnC
MEMIGLTSRAVTSLVQSAASTSAAKMAAENFPVALRVLPRGARDDLAAVYRFARFVDDVGDELPGGRAERLAVLDVIADELRMLPDGGSSLPPVANLADLTRRHDVPVQDYLDLVEANRVDQHVASYATFDDLLGYCRLSAAPVGRIVLHVADAATPASIADSDAVCAALQVLEHCQDVGEDARRDRVYLPAAELRAAGVGDPELTGTATSPRLRRVVADQVTRARGLLAQGAPLVSRLHGWARLAVAGYVAGGLATADALEAATYDVLGQDVRPSSRRTAVHAARIWARPTHGRWVAA